MLLSGPHFESSLVYFLACLAPAVEPREDTRQRSRASLPPCAQSCLASLFGFSQITPMQSVEGTQSGTVIAVTRLYRLHDIGIYRPVSNLNSDGSLHETTFVSDCLSLVFRHMRPSGRLRSRCRRKMHRLPYDENSQHRF